MLNFYIPPVFKPKVPVRDDPSNFVMPVSLRKLELGMFTGLNFPGSRKNFPFPGKNSRVGEFREIAYSPSLQNSVVTVCKSTDAARRRKVPFRSQYRPSAASVC